MSRCSSTIQYDMENQRDMDFAQTTLQSNESIPEESVDAARTGPNLANETAQMMHRSMRHYVRHRSRINHQFNGQFGDAVPESFEGRNQQHEAHVASPVDSVQSVNDGDFFSSTVEEYFPYPRESQGEECTTPDSMPTDNIGPRINNQTYIEENSPEENNTAETIDTSTNTVRSNNNPGAVIINNGAAGHPAELQDHIDFSTDPHEDPNRTNVDTGAIDGQRLAPEEAHADNHTDAANGMEIVSNVTQAAADNPSTTNTNDTINDRGPITERDADEGERILAQENTMIITEVKDDMPRLSRTVSNERTVSDSD